VPSFRVVGPGRAGRSLAAALSAAGWESAGLLGRDDDPAAAAGGVDLLVLATPDAAIGGVVARVRPVPTTVVAHLSGATGLGVLDPHVLRASLHPLVSLPDAEVGARRLVGAWFAVAATEPPAMDLVNRLVDDLGGRSFPVADGDRATYHAAAAVASNHLVALMGQVARLADAVGVPLEAYLDLAAGSLDNVRDVGPSAALTGPAARGDEETVDAHLAALPVDESATYRALAAEARRLAGRPEPGPGT